MPIKKYKIDEIEFKDNDVLEVEFSVRSVNGIVLEVVSIENNFMKPVALHKHGKNTLKVLGSEIKKLNERTQTQDEINIFNSMNARYEKNLKRERDRLEKLATNPENQWEPAVVEWYLTNWKLENNPYSAFFKDEGYTPKPITGLRILENLGALETDLSARKEKESQKEDLMLQILAKLSEKQK
jgi:hypothetical protein